MDILIHADKSTSVYRKPTHTNLYVRYNSCAPSSSKDSVIRSLTRRAYILCSPPTITKRTGHSLLNLLTKWTPPDRVKRIMDSVKQKLENPNKLTLKQFNRQLKATTPSLTASFPFHPTITKKIKKFLASHDVKVTNSSGTQLRDLLTKTKTTFLLTSLPTSLMKFLVMTALPPTMDRKWAQNPKKTRVILDFGLKIDSESLRQIH